MAGVKACALSHLDAIGGQHRRLGRAHRIQSGESRPPGQRWSEVKARVAVLRMSFDASRASMHTALLDARRSGSSRVSRETSCTYARWRNGSGMQRPLEGRHWYARIHAYVTCNVACHVNAQGLLRSLCVISPRRNFPGWLECREGKLLSKIYAGSDLFWPDFFDFDG